MRRTLLSLLLVSACSSLVPTTAAQLSQLSPLEADPAAIALAIRLPPGLVVPEGAARMVIEATRKATGETRRGDYVLASQPGDPAQFATDPGDSLTFFRLASGDVAPMRALQLQVAEWTAADPDGTAGSFSMGLAGCAVGQGPASEAKGSVYIRTEADGAYLPLIRDASIRALIGPDLFAAIGPCTAGPR